MFLIRFSCFILSISITNIWYINRICVGKLMHVVVELKKYIIIFLTLIIMIIIIIKLKEVGDIYPFAKELGLTAERLR